MRCGISWDTVAAVLRLWAILVLIGVGCLALAAGPVSAVTTRVDVRERCSFRLLPDAAVLLTTRLTISNAPGGRPAVVRVLPGWNIARLYPKAKTALVVRLGPGRTTRRVVTRTIPNVPRLWQKLRSAGRINCASKFTYEIS